MDENQTYPFSDDDLIFDSENHRYILTKNYVLKKTGYDLEQILNFRFSSQPQRMVEHTLDQLSEQVYQYIYEHNVNNYAQEYWLENVPSLRNIIKKAMLEQVLYCIDNGNLYNYSGLDLKTGRAINRAEIVRVAIAPMTERILNQVVREIGVPITYSGTILLPFMYKGYGV